MAALVPKWRDTPPKPPKPRALATVSSDNDKKIAVAAVAATDPITFLVIVAPHWLTLLA
jgi:hypothetical protein